MEAPFAKLKNSKDEWKIDGEIFNKKGGPPSSARNLFFHHRVSLTRGGFIKKKKKKEAGWQAGRRLDIEKVSRVTVRVQFAAVIYIEPSAARRSAAASAVKFSVANNWLPLILQINVLRELNYDGAGSGGARDK